MTIETMRLIAGNRADTMKDYLADGFVNTDTGRLFTVEELVELRAEFYAEEMTNLQEGA